MARAAPTQAILDVEYLEGLLEDAEETFKSAEGVARVQALRLVRDLKAELDGARAVEAARAVNEQLTVDGFRVQFAARCRDLATPDLELAVSEYLLRHPGMKLVVE